MPYNISQLARHPLHTDVMDLRKQRKSRSRSPVLDDSKRAHHSSQAYRASPRYRARETAHSLPYGARQLTKHDLNFHRPMFALYLDIQKRLDIEELDDDEVKGRWKSFVNKWNRGDLAEGWYDPATLAKANHTNSSESRTKGKSSDNGGGDNVYDRAADGLTGSEQEEVDDEFGPSLPISGASNTQVQYRENIHYDRAGPTIPTYQDIQSRNEDERVNSETAKETYAEQIRYERKVDRKLQKSRLDEIVPRAEAGTRERQLEKKKEVADSNRAFAASKEEGGDVEFRDTDLMGGDDLGELKRMKKEQDRRKTEREIKREEILRARTAERDQKLKAIREKEEKTMNMLREIARDRFGDGNVQPATLRED